MQREARERRKEEREGSGERLSCSGRKWGGGRLGSRQARAAVWEREKSFVVAWVSRGKGEKGKAACKGNKVKLI